MSGSGPDSRLPYHCDFRRCNETAIDRLFAAVIVLAKALGLLRLGLLALDGTKGLPQNEVYD